MPLFVITKPRCAPEPAGIMLAAQCQGVWSNFYEVGGRDVAFLGSVSNTLANITGTLCPIIAGEAFTVSLLLCVSLTFSFSRSACRPISSPVPRSVRCSLPAQAVQRFLAAALRAGRLHEGIRRHLARRRHLGQGRPHSAQRPRGEAPPVTSCRRMARGEGGALPSQNLASKADDAALYSLGIVHHGDVRNRCHSLSWIRGWGPCVKSCAIERPSLHV